jgi:hypothetical protein
MWLYMPAAGGARTEMLCCYHNYLISEHLSAKYTLELVAMKYY